MRRFILAAAAVASLGIPASVVGLATSAGAATAPSCGKLTGTVTTNITVSSCTPVNAKYKSATAPTSSLASGKGTIKWSPSGKTTTISTTFSQAGSSCPVGSTEYQAKGTVTGGTATYTAKGQAVSGDVCLSATGSLSLVPGTRMKL